MAKKKAVKRKKAEPIIVTTTVAGAVADAFSVIEELAGEMREAFENTPESLQSSGVGERRGECADELENITAPDIPDNFAELPVQYTVQTSKSTSRATRMDLGLQGAREAKDALEAAALTEKDELYDADLELERDSLVSELDDFINEAEAIEFPGMYG